MPNECGFAGHPKKRIRVFLGPRSRPYKNHQRSAASRPRFGVRLAQARVIRPLPPGPSGRGTQTARPHHDQHGRDLRQQVVYGAPERRIRKINEQATVIYAPHAAWPVRQHRFDGGPFIITEFVAHDSRLHFRSFESRPQPYHQPATACRRAADALKLLARSGHSGHGQACYWLEPVANDPKLSIGRQICRAAQRDIAMW
jgi:hypothetical protein